MENGYRKHHLSSSYTWDLALYPPAEILYGRKCQISCRKEILSTHGVSCTFPTLFLHAEGNVTFGPVIVLEKIHSI